MIRRFDFPGDKFKNRIRYSIEKKLDQKEDIALLKIYARKLKFKLKGFRTDGNLELYFDICKNGRSICYVYKGWEDPGFRIAELIELNKYAPDFKEHFYKIFRICSSRLITIGLQEQGRESLSLVLEIGIYKSGFNDRVLKEAIGELTEALAEIEPLL